MVGELHVMKLPARNSNDSAAGYFAFFVLNLSRA